MRPIPVYTETGLEQMPLDDLWTIHTMIECEAQYHANLPDCIKQVYKTDWLPFRTTLSDQFIYAVFPHWDEEEPTRYEDIAKATRRREQRLKMFRSDVAEHPFTACKMFLEYYGRTVHDILMERVGEEIKEKYTALARNVAVSMHHDPLWVEGRLNKQALGRLADKEVFYASHFLRDRGIPCDKQKLKENILNSYEN